MFHIDWLSSSNGRIFWITTIEIPFFNQTNLDIPFVRNFKPVRFCTLLLATMINKINVYRRERASSSYENQPGGNGTRKRELRFQTGGISIQWNPLRSGFETFATEYSGSCQAAYNIFLHYFPLKKINDRDDVNATIIISRTSSNVVL